MGIWIIVIGTVLGLGIAGLFFWIGKDDVAVKSQCSFLVAFLTLIAFPGASVGIASEVDPALFTSTVECTQCGHANEADDAYCAECSHELLPSSVEPK